MKNLSTHPQEDDDHQDRSPQELRRTQIMDAATACLIEKGVSALTMDDVASRAGVAKGTLYLYFSSKADLLGALQERELSGLMEWSIEALSTPAANREQLLAWHDELVRVIVEQHLASPGLHRILFHEIPSNEHALMAALHERLQDYLEQAMASGLLAPTAPDLLAAFLIEGFHGLLMTLDSSPSATKAQAIETACLLGRRVLGTA
jgi:TetR/AcrR family transcriptional repressor of nem operon